jgi:hypothetical protein
VPDQRPAVERPLRNKRGHFTSGPTHVGTKLCPANGAFWHGRSGSPETKANVTS